MSEINDPNEIDYIPLVSGRKYEKESYEQLFKHHKSWESNPLPIQSGRSTLILIPNDTNDSETSPFPHWESLAILIPLLMWAALCLDAIVAIAPSPTNSNSPMIQPNSMKYFTLTIPTASHQQFLDI